MGLRKFGSPDIILSDTAKKKTAKKLTPEEVAAIQNEGETRNSPPE